MFRMNGLDASNPFILNIVAGWADLGRLGQAELESSVNKSNYDRPIAALCRTMGERDWFTKARILAGSFMPAVSTPQGRTWVIAAATLAGVRPPAANPAPLNQFPHKGGQAFQGFADVFLGIGVGKAHIALAIFAESRAGKQGNPGLP